jgi:predicted secreted acid phosphatase
MQRVRSPEKSEGERVQLVTLISTTDLQDVVWQHRQNSQEQQRASVCPPGIAQQEQPCASLVQEPVASVEHGNTVQHRKPVVIMWHGNTVLSTQAWQSYRHHKRHAFTSNAPRS